MELTRGDDQCYRRSRGAFAYLHLCAPPKLESRSVTKHQRCMQQSWSVRAVLKAMKGAHLPQLFEARVMSTRHKVPETVGGLPF